MLVGADSRNTQQLRRCVDYVLSADRLDCTNGCAGVVFFMTLPRPSLFAFDAQVSARCMRRLGEVTVFVSIFLVCTLERLPKKLFFDIHRYCSS